MSGTGFNICFRQSDWISVFCENGVIFSMVTLFRKFMKDWKINYRSEAWQQMSEPMETQTWITTANRTREDLLILEVAIAAASQIYWNQRSRTFRIRSTIGPWGDIGWHFPISWIIWWLGGWPWLPLLCRPLPYIQEEENMRKQWSHSCP